MWGLYSWGCFVLRLLFPVIHFEISFLLYAATYRMPLMSWRERLVAANHSAHALEKGKVRLDIWKA